jgi:hypothetical protein
MDDKFIPKINCRYKIIQDLDHFLGFFQGKGVLTFGEVVSVTKQRQEAK